MLLDPTPTATTAGITNSLIAWTRHNVQNGGSFSCHKNDKLNEEVKSNAWIILGIKTICHCIRVLYLINRNSNNPKLKSYYKFDIGRSVYHFLQHIYIYTFQRDTQCSCTDCLLILRCQLYMFFLKHCTSRTYQHIP